MKHDISWRRKLFFAAIGAVITQVYAPHIQFVLDSGYDIWCGGSKSLNQGKAALRKAIRENRPDLFKEAKEALERSASCHMAEGTFLLAALYCNGFGVEKDFSRSRRLFREAAGREPQWAMEILANPKLCRAERSDH
jgi:hypothetical protein